MSQLKEISGRVLTLGIYLHWFCDQTAVLTRIERKTRRQTSQINQMIPTLFCCFARRCLLNHIAFPTCVRASGNEALPTANKTTPEDTTKLVKRMRFAIPEDACGDPVPNV